MRELETQAVEKEADFLGKKKKELSMALKKTAGSAREKAGGSALDILSQGKVQVCEVKMLQELYPEVKLLRSPLLPPVSS
jgi:hypothetical protein